MYDRLVHDLKSQYPKFPSELSLDIGLAIKHIRLRMGMTQNELAEAAKIKPSALKTLENGYARFTKIRNLDSIARVLRVSTRDLILEAREWFPGNFFVLKLDDPSYGKKRRPKVRQEIWFKRKLLSYNDYHIDFLSPPILEPSHFCFALIEIQPGKKIEGLKLKHPNQVAGFIQRGSLRIVYDSKEEIDLFGNQSFILRGDKTHDFINLDKDNPVKLRLAFSFTTTRGLNPNMKPSTSLAIGQAIQQIRHLFSDSKTRPLSFAELSYLTGLEEKSLQYLEKTTEPDQVIYWDKIEKITQALKMPMARFLDLAEGKDSGYLHIATAHDRALIDYRHYLGIRMKSVLLPRVNNDFHVSETYIEPKGGIRRLSWRRTDEAMIAADVEDGEILIEVGKNRKALLKQGESIYFDGRLGYIFTNPGTKPCKLVIATYPAIIF